MGHKAVLFNDRGVASGRGWYILHSETCKFLKNSTKCNEGTEVEAVKAAVQAIYDAHPWPYPVGLWPVAPDVPMNKEFEFSLVELRDHLESWKVEAQRKPEDGNPANVC